MVWAAKQISSLQHVSGGRIILGIGAGGDRHALSRESASVRKQDRGRLTDAALRALPDLIAGKPVVLDGESGAPTVQLAPGTAVPPIVVGGMSDVAMRAPDRAGLDRLLTDPDGRFGMPPEAIEPVLVGGAVGEVAERLAGYRDSGAERLVVTIAGGDWHRQAELLADAYRLATR